MMRPIVAMMAGCRRVLAFLAGGWLVLVPGCGAHQTRPTEPATAPAAEPVPAQPTGPRPRQLAVRGEPLPPGPVPADVALPFDLDQDTPRAALDPAQWLLFEAWALRAGERAPVPGQGSWTASFTEKPQPFAPSLRFFEAGGLMGAHFALPGANGVIHRGWPLFLRNQPDRGVLLACRAELWPALHDLDQTQRAGELDDATYGERHEALFARHCEELWPELWAGLQQATRPALETTVLAFVVFWAARDHGRPKLVRTAAELPPWALRAAGPVPTGPDPSPPPLTPEVRVTPDGRIHASGTLLHFSSSIDSVSRFQLEVGPEGCTLGLEELGHSAPRVPY